nr:NADH dehydrogenase subunit 6 [Anadara broughtonii]UVJ66712.1 NADH dehydrogenase subunit 6 [Anadara broughtonii]UVJ66724.1 NADH dehydrogenase subunit 6 [Anadara broughtonii]
MSMVSHPLLKGGMLLLMSMCVGVGVGKFVSVWLGLALVLVYAGGVLVLFCYVCCLAPGFFFPLISMKWFFGLLIWWVMFMDSLTTTECWQFFSVKESWKVCLYPDHCGMVPLLGCVLCLVLLGVSKMSQIDKGPLRLFRLEQSLNEMSFDVASVA